jgi:uncharacterized LabA/DUF88 family protein
MTSEDLTKWIKCDSCSAQALWLARGTNGELYFCGHHRNKFSQTLDKWAYEIIDLDKKEEVQQLEKEEV